jgi:protein-tyrosine phosphatase
MTATDTAALLAQLATPGDARLPAILELTARRDPGAAKPIIKLLREPLTDAELAAVLAAIEVVGNRAILPMLQHMARARPDLADRIDAVHALIKRAPPAGHEDTGLRWVAVGGGRLAIGPRPKVRALAELRAGGATHLVTLLSESEEARALGDAAVAAGLAWLWLPLKNGDPPAQHRDDAMRTTLDAWTALLAGGAAFYIHCAAGIHRTGMVSHALLRRAGHDPDHARRLLAELRPLTAAEAGEHRLAWGHRFAP